MELVVVVPTRNRADLAPASIGSVLAGGDPRVRAIVSDNSTDVAQAEQLRAASAEMTGVKHLRPPVGLPMTAHWQWALERALEDSATSHVMYLSDRRVLRRGAVSELLAVAERYPSDVLTFGDDIMVRDDEQPVKLVERPWTGSLMRIDARHLLRVSARGMSHVALPRMLNSVVPRAVLEEVGKAYGSVFASIAPDHCFGYRCLDHVESILHLDRVLVVQRAMGRSNGYSQTRGVVNADHTDFLRELRGSQINQHAPVPELLTVTNAAYNEYEYVRGEAASSKLEAPRRHFYLGANARDVALLEDPQLRGRMRDVLAAHGWSNPMRLRYAIGLSVSAAGYYGPRPRALLRRLRSRPLPQAEFHDPAQALAYALERHGARSSDAPHLWPLMSRPGAAQELPADSHHTRAVTQVVVPSP